MMKFVKRRGKLNSITHNFTKEEWEQKVAFTEGFCPSCNRPYAEGFGLTLDHTPPISKAPIGFVYNIDNINPMCHSCNASKGSN